jgi:UDP-N-acetylmuramoyl-L-alanyl-D-glutamate--2,6-diaminopimelate ligase
MILRALIDFMDFELVGDGSTEVTGITCDSRSVKDGDLFAALPGAVSDGYEFAGEAVANGASCVLGQRPTTALKAPQVIVADARAALASVSAVFYGAPSERMTLVGITGTNGKTTVAYILEAIFTAAGFKTGVIGTINYRYAGSVYPAPHTTPESPELSRILKEMADAGVTHCVMEVSSHALLQKRVNGCRFDAAVFMNLTHEHLDYHDTMEEYFGAKSLLFGLLKMEGRSRKVVNMDDEWGLRLGAELGPVMGFGIEESAEVHPAGYSFTANGIEAVIVTGEDSFKITSALIGRHNLSNILAAVTVARSLSIGPDDIAKGISALKGVPGRLESVSVEPPAAFRAYVDYAHTAAALETVLGELAHITKGRIITVFGCGGNRDRAKRPEMARAVARHSTLMIITSDNPRDEDPASIIAEVESGMEGVRRLDDDGGVDEGKGYLVIPDRREAIRKAVGLALPGDTLLVAGKGHEDYQIISGHRLPFDDREELKAAIGAAVG